MSVAKRARQQYNSGQLLVGHCYFFFNLFFLSLSPVVTPGSRGASLLERTKGVGHREGSWARGHLGLVGERKEKKKNPSHIGGAERGPGDSSGCLPVPPACLPSSPRAPGCPVEGGSPWTRRPRAGRSPVGHLARSEDGPCPQRAAAGRPGGALAPRTARHGGHRGGAAPCSPGLGPT